jgi:hypothetical protein
VLIQGIRETRGALERWNGDPWPLLRTWLLASVAVAAGLLGAVWLVASVVTPDPTPVYVPGVSYQPGPLDAVEVLGRNSLVLALHATACVAGFIAGSSLPRSAMRRTGLSRRVHERAGPVAIAFVAGVTLFSLTTQAYVLGSTASTLAAEVGLSPGTLVLTVLPHALPELVALFLPLAAWLVASRRGEWQELLAATIATVGLAAPVLIAAAAWETYVWPLILRAASPALG